MTEIIDDIQNYSDDMNYYYYAENYSGNHIYAYMSNNQLEESERPPMQGNIVELAIGSSEGLSRNDIKKEIKYKNYENVEITYDIGSFLTLCKTMYDIYCAEGYPNRYINMNMMKYLINNLFGIFLEYILYNDIKYYTIETWPANYHRKVGLLLKNRQDLIALNGGYPNINYTSELPLWLESDNDHFNYAENFMSYNEKRTDIMENFIKDGTLNMEQQLILVNAFQTVFYMTDHTVYYAPFWVDGATSSRGNGYFVQYANDEGKSVISMLQEAIDGNTTVDIKPYLDNDHLWICDYVKNDQGGYIYPNTNRNRIRLCKPYLKLVIVEPFYIRFPDDTIKDNTDDYIIIWDELDETALASKENYITWINNQITRIKKISECIFDFTDHALSIIDGVYQVDSFVNDSIRRIYSYCKAINNWWNTCPFNEENMRTICGLYGIEYANLNEITVKQITGNLCGLNNGEFHTTGLWIAQALFNKVETNIWNTRVGIYPSLQSNSQEYLTDFSENQTSARRAQWLPFSRTNQSELEPSLTDTPGCLYAELLDILRSPVYPAYISDIKQYTIDQEYIYSNPESKTLLMSEVRLTEDDYSGIGNCTRYDIQDE